MMIYISHPYGGNKSNLEAIEAIVMDLAARDKANVYVSPVHCFGWMYDTVDYLHGLGMCIELLSRCDRMLVYGDWMHSTGCRAEVDYCKAHGIPYVVHYGDGESGKRQI